MANQVKLAILKTMIENEVVEILVKSRVDNIYLADGTTTLASKLAEMIASINEKAKTTDMETAISTAISSLRTELMGEGVPEAYDTFKELADYIATHKEASDALTAAIGDKADKTAVEAIQRTVDALGAMASKDVVAEADLDDALREKVNAASEGNHSHNNKTLLDSYTQTEADLADAVAKKHEHANKSLLDSYDQSNVDIKDAVSKKHNHTKTDEEMADAVDKKHNHTNKALLDTYTQTEENLADAVSKKHSHANATELAKIADGDKAKWDEAEQKAHTHENSEVLAGIKATDITAWNAKTNVYAQESQPTGLKAGDIWVQLV